MKVLVDEDTSLAFTRRLRDILEPEGATVDHTQELGWAGSKNGLLLSLAADRGCSHLITSDKMMAEESPASIPVLVVDQMPKQNSQLTHHTAETAAMMLLENEVDEPGYHAVIVEGHEPSKRLKRIAAGEHRMSPRGMERRRRRDIRTGATPYHQR